MQTRREKSEHTFCGSLTPIGGWVICLCISGSLYIADLKGGSVRIFTDEFVSTKSNYQSILQVKAYIT